MLLKNCAIFCGIIFPHKAGSVYGFHAMSQCCMTKITASPSQVGIESCSPYGIVCPELRPEEGISCLA
jgi:hypothetical protein